MLRSHVIPLSQPAVEAVALPDMLNFCRVSDAGEGPQLALYTSAAREVIEHMTGRALISRQYGLTMPRWSDRFDDNIAMLSQVGAWFNLSDLPRGYRNGYCNTIWLERSPLISVESVQYYDLTGTLQTLNSSAYFVLTRQYPGGVSLSPDYYWPDLYNRPDAVQVNFTAGHGTAPAQVPAHLRQALMVLTKHYYDGGREVVDLAQAVQEIPFGVRDIMAMNRVGGYVA